MQFSPSPDERRQQSDRRSTPEGENDLYRRIQDKLVRVEEERRMARREPAPVQFGKPSDT